MTDPNVHVATHPTGEPNRTAVNADNPIFGRPADPIPEVSLQQAAVVQSEKNPRETVQSPLINEEVASPVPVSVEPVVENTETLPEQSAEEVTAVQEDGQAAVQAEDAGSDSERNGSKADDWTQTIGAGLTADTSSAETGAEYKHSSGEGSSKITPVVPVGLPTQEEAEAVVAQAAAEEDERKKQAEAVDHFKIGEKVRFTAESGNDTTEVFTIDGGELGQGDNPQWFWRLVEKPGELFLEKNLRPAGLAEA